MKLIDNWRKAHKLWSVRIQAAGAIVTGAWASIPADLRDHLPYLGHLAAGLFVAGIASRLISQETAGGK